MWPWEHALVGYIVLSLIVHLFRRRSPSGSEAVLVALASVLPDLIDKPLGWQYDVFASGYGLGHSILFAVPLSIAVLLLAAVVDRADLGTAFGVGYLLHLAGDVVPHYFLDGELPVEKLLWPVVATESSYPDGFSGTFVSYLRRYVAEVLAGEPAAYLLFALVSFGTALWIYDGLPGLRGPVGLLLRSR